MKVETLKDVLQWTQKFHQYLSSCLQHCAAENINERSRLLLNYLSQHEHHLEKLVEEAANNASSNALNTWCQQYIDKHPIAIHQKCEEAYSSMSTVEISQVIFEQHRQLMELYRYLYSQAGAPSAIALIATLIELEEHEAMQMAKGANSLEDL